MIMKDLLGSLPAQYLSFNRDCTAFKRRFLIAATSPQWPDYRKDRLIFTECVSLRVTHTSC